MKKKMGILVLVVAMCMTTVTGCGSLDDKAVIATVGDTKISAGVANFYVRWQQAQYETYYASFMGKDMWSSKISDGVTYEDSIKDASLKMLETMYALKNHSKDYEVTITEEEQNTIDKTAKQFVESNGLAEKKIVSGSEKKTVAEVLSLMMIQEKMKKVIVADVNTEVSDEEATQKGMQYVSFPFTTTATDGTATQLTEEEIATLKETAKTFATGAKEASDFAAYATEAGYKAETATFDAKSTTVNQELVKVADTLGEGQVSDLVETENGCYVAKVTTLLDREGTDAKKLTIVKERQQKKFEEVSKKLLKKDGAKVNKSTWNKIDFEKQGVVVKEVNTKPYTDGPATEKEK
ncbi:MAG: peptidyl-prolyl cis-trans isomerase [Lachnospiraceae bacterium]